MIGDKLIIKPEFFKVAERILKTLPHICFIKNKKCVIGIGGESGCGKSVAAHCLKELLAVQGIKALILQQDDYFKFPPKTNDSLRLANISWVGMNEVNLDLLQSHINLFKNNGNYIKKPLIDFARNSIKLDTLNCLDYDILIIEGTYTLTLENLDFRVFFSASFQDTLSQREERNREVMTDYLDRILKIEHQIIAPFHKLADVIVNKDFEVKV